jgi:hypothetical protein
MWLGAAVFFSASVAPNVFGVLRGADLANASSLAGSIVSPLLSTLNRAGFEIAIFLLVMSFFLTCRPDPNSQTGAFDLAGRAGDYDCRWGIG